MRPEEVARDDLAALISVCLQQHYGLDSTQLSLLDEVDDERYALSLTMADDLLIEFRRPLSSPPAEVLVAVALRAKATLHSKYCSSTNYLGCWRERRFLQDLLTILAKTCYSARTLPAALNVFLDSFSASGLSLAELVPALEVAMQEALLFARRPRRPWHPQTGVAVVQINGPLTEVSKQTFEENLAASERFEEPIQRHGFEAEITALYAPLDDKFEPSASEEGVIGSLLHASAAIFWVDDGQIGTGEALSITRMYQIPTLTLTRGRPILAARFTGSLARRQEVLFSSVEEGLEHVERFLDANRNWILNRADQLRKYATLDVGHLRERYEAIDHSLFIDSGVTAAMAGFAVSSPVIWFQMPTPIRDNIAHVLGLQPSHATTPTSVEPAGTRRGQEVSLVEASFRSLLVAAQLYSWSFEVIEQLFNLYTSGRHSNVVSARDETVAMAVEDWRDLNSKGA